MKKILSVMIAVLMVSACLLSVHAAEDITSESISLPFIYCTDGVEGGTEENYLTATYTIPAATPNKLILAITFPANQSPLLQEYVVANATKVNGAVATIAMSGTTLTVTHEAATAITSGEYVVEFCGLSAPKYTQKTKINVTVPGSDAGETIAPTLPFYYCTNGEATGTVENYLAASYTVSGKKLVIDITFPANESALVAEYATFNTTKVNGNAASVTGSGVVLTVTYEAATAITGGEYEIEFCGSGAPTYTQKTKINVTVPGDDAKPVTPTLPFYYCTNGETTGTVENYLAASYTVSGNKLVFNITFPADQSALVAEYATFNTTKVNGNAASVTGSGVVLTVTYEAASAITNGDFEIEFGGSGSPTYTQKTVIAVDVEEGSPNTFDAITLVGAIAVISAAGVAISKKKR